MTIYNRFGDKLNIIERNGYQEIRAQYTKTPIIVMLVKIRHADDNSERYCLAETLKADKGMGEIEQAFLSAPLHVLTGRELAMAMKEAR